MGAVTSQQMTDYPVNWPNGISIGGLPIVNSYTGQVFWVDSVNGADGNPGSFKQPFASLNRAMAIVQAGRGDVVFLKAGHAETLVTAGALTLNVAGVSVVGLGTGDNRPTFTFTPGAVGTAPMVISANNVSINNIIGKTGLNAVTTPISITGAGVTLMMEWQDVTSFEAATVVQTAATADNLTLNMRYRGLVGSAVCVAPIKLTGADGARVNVDFFGKASVAVVNFTTTAVTDAIITGFAYNATDTTGVKLVVDTVGGSTWSAQIEAGAVGGFVQGGSAAAMAPADISTVIADLQVATANAATNLLERDVVGNKTDTAVATVGTTASVIAYLKGVINDLQAGTANAAANVLAADVIGNKTDTAVTTVGTTASLMAYEKGQSAMQEVTAVTTAAIMSNALVVFNVTGDIELLGLVSECITPNNATASTVTYQSNPTVGAAAAFTGASASLANALAGASLSVVGTTLATAPNLVTSAANLGIAAPLFIPAGTISLVVAVGSTSGTWRHYIRYRPAESGAIVTAAF